MNEKLKNEGFHLIHKAKEIVNIKMKKRGEEEITILDKDLNEAVERLFREGDFMLFVNMWSKGIK